MAHAPVNAAFAKVPSLVSAGCAVVLMASACDNVDYIELEPAAVTFKEATERKFLEAKAMSRAGKRNTMVKIVWSVKDPAIASVEPNGEVRPLKSGFTEVIARTSGNIEARCLVNVLFTEQILVEPKAITVTEGAAAVPVKVTSLGFDGRVLDGRKAVMSSRDQKIAQIVGGNQILGLDPGSTTVVVKVDGKTAEIAVVVEAEAKPK